jgi:hypothetical protein
MNSAMKKWVRAIFDKFTLRLLGWPTVERFVGLLAYQRRRIIRARLERQLRDQGVYQEQVIHGPFSGLTYLVNHLASAKPYQTIFLHVFSFPNSASHAFIVSTRGAP